MKNQILKIKTQKCKNDNEVVILRAKPEGSRTLPLGILHRLLAVQDDAKRQFLSF